MPCSQSPTLPLYYPPTLSPTNQVHGDVFRPPRYIELLAALVGTGVQLALLVLSVILITIAGALASAPVGAACVGGPSRQAWGYNKAGRPR